MCERPHGDLGDAKAGAHRWDFGHCRDHTTGRRLLLQAVIVYAAEAELAVLVVARDIEVAIVEDDGGVAPAARDLAGGRLEECGD